jgi:cytochrome b561
MPLRNTREAYGAVARFAHWATALFVVLAWLLGQFRDVLPRGVAREGALFAHMSLGLGVILLLVLRLVWRALDPSPPAILTPRFEPWLGLAAKAGHLLLYALLIAAPVLGIALQFARGQALPVFGLFEIASPWAQDRALFRQIIELHELAANALGVVALGHAAAALFHHFSLRDRTLARMLPGLAR